MIDDATAPAPTTVNTLLSGLANNFAANTESPAVFHLVTNLPSIIATGIPV